MYCTSISQLFIHLQNLDESIAWSKSVLNTRCRVCRKKGDADRMLLCDKCDNGHHIYCLRPSLPSIPNGEWFCPECKPKATEKKPRKIRKSFVSNDLYSDECEMIENDKNLENEDNEAPEKDKVKTVGGKRKTKNRMIH